MKPLLLLLLPLVLALLVACGDDEQSANDQFCEDLDALAASASDLFNSIGSLDRTQVEESFNDLQEKVDAVVESGNELREGRSGELSNDFDRLRDAFASLGEGGSNLGSTLSQIATIVREMADDVQTLIQEYSC
jgi:type II secretory pathway component PulF